MNQWPLSPGTLFWLHYVSYFRSSLPPRTVPLPRVKWAQCIPLLAVARHNNMGKSLTSGYLFSVCAVLSWWEPADSWFSFKMSINNITILWSKLHGLDLDCPFPPIDATNVKLNYVFTVLVILVQIDWLIDFWCQTIFCLTWLCACFTNTFLFLSIQRHFMVIFLLLIILSNILFGEGPPAWFPPHGSASFSPLFPGSWKSEHTRFSVL